MEEVNRWNIVIEVTYTDRFGNCPSEQIRSDIPTIDPSKEAERCLATAVRVYYHTSQGDSTCAPHYVGVTS
jgi:hypothetical protein